jgi:hypothetical protein
MEDLLLLENIELTHSNDILDYILDDIVDGIVLFDDDDSLIVTNPRPPTYNETIFDIYGYNGASKIYKNKLTFINDLAFFKNITK